MGAELEALLGLLASRPRRETRPPRAERLLALPLPDDVRAFFTAWADHPPPHVSLGELWFDDKDPGDYVPQVGDLELKLRGRDDVVMFAHSPGGDLFAVKLATGEIVRLVHDREWSEYVEAASLEAFVEACAREAAGDGAPKPSPATPAPHRVPRGSYGEALRTRPTITDPQQLLDGIARATDPSLAPFLVELDVPPVFSERRAALVEIAAWFDATWTELADRNAEDDAYATAYTEARARFAAISDASSAAALWDWIVLHVADDDHLGRALWLWEDALLTRGVEVEPLVAHFEHRLRAANVPDAARSFAANVVRQREVLATIRDLAIGDPDALVTWAEGVVLGLGKDPAQLLGARCLAL